MADLSSLRVSLIQLAPGHNRDANLAEAETLARRAIEAAQPDVVVLPEVWNCLGGNRATKFAAAEPVPQPGETPGPAYRLLQNLARATRTTIHGGSIIEADGDRLYNTTLVFDPAGQEIARYRKIHLFDVVTPDGAGYRESATFGAGCDVVTTKIGGFTVGLAICYDLRFPELFAALRRQGAELIILPAAFTQLTGQDHWEVLLRARAIETQCWMAACGSCGFHSGPDGDKRQTYGNSLIADPWGRVTARLAGEPGFITGAIERVQLERVRADMPVFAHHRLPLAHS